MPFPKKSPQLLAAAFLVVSLVFSIGLPVEGKGKKSRRAYAKSKTKSGVVTSSARGSSSRRKTARRGKRYRQRVSRDTLALEAYPITTTLPDSIEVIEHGSSDSPVLGRLLNLPNPNRTDNAGFTPTDISTPVRRINIKMEASRVIEIQQALGRRGFYRGELTGVYDETTLDAMRRFQVDEKISVTGYPTAHALRKLGLASW